LIAVSKYILYIREHCSDVFLLLAATTHVKYLEMTAQQLQTRLQQAEAEVQRLRTSVFIHIILSIRH
jgi:hypothetical protein